ncbi:hypothetical protein L218DRAFT_945264 [Marasmius fiardii PR-910]|nr:hypothetical protein L218DRAFT_945264 [Marasmius fiardii PR-910]
MWDLTQLLLSGHSRQSPWKMEILLYEPYKLTEALSSDNNSILKPPPPYFSLGKDSLVTWQSPVWLMNHIFKTQYQLKVEELKVLFHGHKLSVSGKKANLQKQLREFSEKPEKWDIIKPGAQHALRGPRNTSSNMPKTGYHQQRLALLASTATEATTENTEKHTKEEEDDLLKWAVAYVADHLEIQEPHPLLKERSGIVNKVVDAHMLSDQLDGISKMLNGIITSCLIPAMPESSSAVYHHLPWCQQLCHLTAVEYLQKCPWPQQPDLVKTLEIWSDNHPCFNPNDCEVVIQGYGIALKYWPQGGLKSHHNEWKFNTEEYLRFNSSEEFWNKYSKSGERMTFSEIADMLRVACKQAARD